MERVHVDILGPFVPSLRGNQYVLVLVDQFTKWIECYPLPVQNAETIARAVVDGFISREGGNKLLNKRLLWVMLRERLWESRKLPLLKSELAATAVFYCRLITYALTLVPQS